MSTTSTTPQNNSQSIVDILKPGISVRLDSLVPVSEIINDGDLRDILNIILRAENIETIENKLREVREKLGLNDKIPDNDINRIIRESFGSGSSLPSDNRTKFKRILKVIDKFYNLVSGLRINQNTKRTLLDRIKVFHVDYSDKFIDAIYILEDQYGSLEPIPIMYELYRVLSFERNGYEHFDDVEWFLVLMSKWASVNNGYLPVCPTKKHTSTLRLYVMYKERDLNSISVNNIKDLIERIIGFST